MSDQCPACFGVEQKIVKPVCISCEFREACKVCRDMPDKKINRLLGFVSYDRFSYSREVADETGKPGDVHEEGELLKQQRYYTQEDLMYILSFLLKVDDYSLQILSEIVVKGRTLASDVARDFGVSRQAIHRKIRDSCIKYPELREMFKAYLYRCKSIINKRANRNSVEKRKRQLKHETQKYTTASRIG